MILKLVYSSELIRRKGAGFIHGQDKWSSGAVIKKLYDSKALLYQFIATDKEHLLLGLVRPAEVVLPGIKLKYQMTNHLARC